MGNIQKMGARVNYTRSKSWNTRSNKIRQVRTPGGRLVAQYVAKRVATPKSAIVTEPTRLGGLRRMRPHAYKLQSKHTRRVSRAYGGVFSHGEVKKTMAMTAAAESKKNKKGGKTVKGGKRRQVKK